MRKFKNIEEFKNEFISDVNLQNEFKENPEQFVKQISTRKTLLDKKIFSYVIFFCCNCLDNNAFRLHRIYF